MPSGLDYSNRIQDEDLVAPENERERKRRKRNKKLIDRNNSSNHLSSGNKFQVQFLYKTL